MLRARATPTDDRLAAQWLSASELALWRRQSSRDRAHAARVARRLLRANHDDLTLLKAALLHDVGKSIARVGLHDRVVLVLLQAFTSGWLKRLTGPAPTRQSAGWAATLSVLRHHATIGAELARAAGSSAEVVALIADHDCVDAAIDHRLARLRWADID